MAGKANNKKHFSCLHQQAVTVFEERGNKQWACPVRPLSRCPWATEHKRLEVLLMGMSTAMLQLSLLLRSKTQMCVPVGGYVLPFGTTSNQRLSEICSLLETLAC